MGIDGGKPHLDRFGRREAESGPSFCVRTFRSFPVSFGRRASDIAIRPNLVGMRSSLAL